jgi:hypothetical protein
MKIEIIGPWVLLGVGLILLARAIFPKILPPRHLLILLVFGFLSLGLGVYGLEFMPKYGDWLDKIKDWIIDNPTEESYAKLFESVGTGKMPGKLKDMAVNYAISHPIEGMEDALAGKIKEAPDGKPGKAALENGFQYYQDKKKTIDRLLETAPTDRQAMQFDAETEALIYHRLKQMSPDQVRALGIDPSTVPKYKPERKN